jgi:hypothetical protein
MQMPRHPTEPLLVGILWSAPARPSIPMAGPAAGATPEIRALGAPSRNAARPRTGTGSTAEVSVAPRRKNVMHRRVVTSPLDPGLLVPAAARSDAPDRLSRSLLHWKPGHGVAFLNRYARWPRSPTRPRHRTTSPAGQGKVPGTSLTLLWRRSRGVPADAL